MATLFSEDVSGMRIPLVEANSSIFPPYGEYGSNAQQEDVLSSGFIPNPDIQQPFSFQPMMANQPPSSIVGGMFSPEISRAAQMEYMQKRQDAMRERALAFAQLNPMQQADYGFYRGGQQLGDALSGALGGTDPQLQKIGLQQQILSELDPSNPEQNLMIAQKYARVAPDLAMKIADSARTALVRIKQAQGANRQGVTAKIQEAERVAESKGFAKGTPEFEKEVAAYLQKPEKPEARPSVGSDREAFALTEFNKNYYDLTPEQRIKVNALADAEVAKRAAASAPKVQVDLKDPTAVAKSNLDVMGKWENFLKSGGDVEVANRYKSVQSAVVMANAGNPSADGALLYNIAKMYDPSGSVQEGDKKSITGNPNIPTRFKLLVQGVLEGGSFTPEQRKDLEKIADQIVKNRQSQLNVYRKQYVNKIKDLKGTEQDILDPYQGLIRPPLSTFTQTPNTNPQNITGGRR